MAKTISKDSTEQSQRERNYWLVRGEVADKTRHVMSVFVRIDYDRIASKVFPDDGVIVVDEKMRVLACASVYRARAVETGVVFYFVRSETPDSNSVLHGFDAPGPIQRMTRGQFEAQAGKSIDALRVIASDGERDENQRERAYIRKLLQEAVEDDLLGPANGVHETIIGMSVHDRYLVGKLAPGGRQEEDVAIEEDDDVELDETRLSNAEHAFVEDNSRGESNDEPDTSVADDMTDQKSISLTPHSVGMTFCVDASVEKIELKATWGRYERADTESEKRVWRRVPCGGTISLKLENQNYIVVDENNPEVVVKCLARHKDKGTIVTLFLINEQEKARQNIDARWVFQPEMRVCAKDGESIFLSRAEIFDPDNPDEEIQQLKLNYRKRMEFAVGHGISVHAEADAVNPQRAVMIQTRVIPFYEVKTTETPGTRAGDRNTMLRMVRENLFDMKELAELSVPERRHVLVKRLRDLTADYAAWIADNLAIAKADKANWKTLRIGVNACKIVLQRLNEGISVLEKDDIALKAFGFANRAMMLQREHSIYALKRRQGIEKQKNYESVSAHYDEPKNRTWRAFQLAFILLSIPALADPKHPSRTDINEAVADLLWFPTGGGKTEAYLGVAAFCMGIRRLQKDSCQYGDLNADCGLSVIMRYTLRLLTLQQFQRATALICAMEQIRLEEPAIWGTDRFRLGLWVGAKVTPNKGKDSKKEIEQQHEQNKPKRQLTFCPWCGEPMDANSQSYDIETHVRCNNIYCLFSKGKAGRELPVVTVDEEIYQNPPSMLISTVDKFAMMAWNGMIATLFGRATRKCREHGLTCPDGECMKHRTKVETVHAIRPPDLIIQDEFHLISGPLGTMVGLYETAIDELCSWECNGKKVYPKVIASTATVRRAEIQIRNVFNRNLCIFPPSGLDTEDNYFSVQRDPKEIPGRMYMGICAPGSSRPAAMIRINVALLTAAMSLYHHFGKSADPYMTLVGYFNALRELGGMRRLAEDDICTRAKKVDNGDIARPGLKRRYLYNSNIHELTSRMSNDKIPEILDALDVEYVPYDPEKDKKVPTKRAIDIVLATNMLSVGVDVNRLGLMSVNGQPKNTAEYIQATSRVGRQFPGIVCTLLNWARPRDLSHYETFEHYHATFYKHVEALSVTPFATKALDRGLTGVLVSLMRLKYDRFNANHSAQALTSCNDSDAQAAKQSIVDRAVHVVDMFMQSSVETATQVRLEKWAKKSNTPGIVLTFKKEKQPTNVALIESPGKDAWTNRTVATSMREVEPEVAVFLNLTLAENDNIPEWKSNMHKDTEA